MSHARKIQKQQMQGSEELHKETVMPANVVLMSSKNHELLAYGILAINQAHNEGKITLKEWVRLTREWAERVLEEPDEMLTCDRPDGWLDS